MIEFTDMTGLRNGQSLRKGCITSYFLVNIIVRHQRGCTYEGQAYVRFLYVSGD